MSVRRLIPNLFTAGNLVCGVLAIIFILEGKIEFAPILVIIAGVCDLLDGMMARILKVTSPLGKQLDSLADMVTFGVVPGILMYKMIGIPYQHDGQFHAFTLFGLIIPVFALFRLAKFNIDDRQEEDFIGLPTPAMTLFFVGLVGIIYHYIHHLDAYSNEARFVRNWLMNKYVLISLSFLFSVLMVVPLRMFSLKFKHGKWKGNEVRYIFLTISAVLLATLFWWALPIIIVLYVILSLVHNLISRKDAEPQSN